MEFKHPNYYKNLRKLYRSRNRNQAISDEASTEATSPKQQASSFKPEATSSLILEPRYMDIGEVLGDKGPRVFIMIKVFLGCATWKAIWCGEKRTLFPFVTFNSKVKKCPELL